MVVLMKGWGQSPEYAWSSPSLQRSGKGVFEAPKAQPPARAAPGPARWAASCRATASGPGDTAHCPARAWSCLTDTGSQKCSQKDREGNTAASTLSGSQHRVIPCVLIAPLWFKINEISFSGSVPQSITAQWDAPLWPMLYEETAPVLKLRASICAVCSW